MALSKQSPALKAALARPGKFELTLKEWLTITPEEKEDIARFYSLDKDGESTRKIRIDNDDKEGRTIDAEALSYRIASVIKGADSVLEHQMVDILPARIMGLATLDEARAAANECLKTTKLELNKVWDQFDKR